MATEPFVLNRCYGGFGLSPEGEEMQKEGKTIAEIIELIGDRANGVHARLKVYQVPSALMPVLDLKEYDGYQWIEYNMTEFLRERIATLDASNLDEFKGQVLEMFRLIDIEDKAKYTSPIN